MIVCIAEKPSVAKDIANILGATSKQDGYFEGNGYQVTWAFGHLCELKAPNEYNSDWYNWKLDNLPLIPSVFSIKIKKEQSIEDQFLIIESLIQDAEMIINCGDAGQEGEVIQRWVMQKANTKCPVKRLWINSLTEEAIKEGFSNLRDASDFDSLYEAGISRSIGDWLLGMNATRLYSLKYGKTGQVLSVGRVQTPTLAMIVKRQKEIENFKSAPYWVLSTLYKDINFTITKGKFESREEGEEVLNSIRNKEFEIVNIQSKEIQEVPPQLYDLITLQVECNKQFGFSAEQTLSIIQSLYEKKVVTYPRVDTRYLSDDIYPKCGNIIATISGYEREKKYLRELKTPLIKSKRVFDSSKVTDHHAIIPTGIPIFGLNQNEYLVYDLIVRAFIAVFYPNCQIQQMTVLGKIEDIEFKATDKQILDLGWRFLYSNQEQKENKLKILKEGEKGEHKPVLLEKKTIPPKYYTEATLLRAMETAGQFVEDELSREALKQNGIGRPSSRANIIETLFKREYIKRDKTNLIATDLGIHLIEIIDNELLKSPELTGQWERKLRDIESKKFTAKQFIAELTEQIKSIVNSELNKKLN